MRPTKKVLMDNGEPVYDADDSAVFIEHARWLLEWHNRRSEAMAGRATAVLGFNGVMMALLLQGAGLRGIEPTAVTWVLFVSALTALLGSAVAALSALKLATVRMPPVSQLRNQWLTHRVTSNTGQASRNIAEAFLTARTSMAPPRSPTPLRKRTAELPDSRHRSC